jgi:NAD-dependent SIR2 family protein deacetylase
MSFDKDYLIYDEFGLKEVHCLCCDEVIKSRVELQSEKHPGSFIREMAKHAQYREMPVVLSDGNISFLMVCEGCKFHQITDVEAERITNQIKDAARTQMLWEGKLPDLIDKILESQTRKVLRNAEVAEVTKAMKGVI